MQVAFSVTPADLFGWVVINHNHRTVPTVIDVTDNAISLSADAGGTPIPVTKVHDSIGSNLV